MKLLIPFSIPYRYVAHSMYSTVHYICLWEWDFPKNSNSTILVVHIDKHLTWNDHMKDTRKFLRQLKNLGAIAFLCHELPCKTPISLHNTLINLCIFYYSLLCMGWLVFFQDLHPLHVHPPEKSRSSDTYWKFVWNLPRRFCNLSKPSLCFYIYQCHVGIFIFSWHIYCKNTVQILQTFSDLYLQYI